MRTSKAEWLSGASAVRAASTKSAALAAAKDAVVEAAVEWREHASSENLNLLIDALDVYLKLKEGDE